MCIPLSTVFLMPQPECVREGQEPLNDNDTRVKPFTAAGLLKETPAALEEDGQRQRNGLLK